MEVKNLSIENELKRIAEQIKEEKEKKSKTNLGGE
jgi:hypothetical protein